MLGFSALAVAPIGTVPPISTRGSLSAVLGGLSGAGYAALAINGGSDGQLSSLTLAGAGGVAIGGTTNATLGALTGSGLGGLALGGALSGELAALQIDANGRVAISAAATVVLDAAVGTGEAFLLNPIAGAGDGRLGALTSGAAGRLRIAGAAGITLGGVTFEAGGRLGDVVAARFLKFRALGRDLAFTAPARPLAFRAHAQDLLFVAERRQLTFTAPARRLLFTARADGGTMQKLPTKQPNEVWQCTIDCTPWIPDGESLAAFTGERIAGTATVGTFELASASSGGWRVSGGDAGTTTTFRVTATISDGQVFSDTFSVFVVG